MAATKKIAQNAILYAAVEVLQSDSISSINARSAVKQPGYSTQLGGACRIGGRLAYLVAHTFLVIRKSIAYASVWLFWAGASLVLYHTI